MGAHSEKHTQSTCTSACVCTCPSAGKSGRTGTPSLSWEEGSQEKTSRRRPGLALFPGTQAPPPILLLSRIAGFGWHRCPLMGQSVSTGEGPGVCQFIPDSVGRWGRSH